MNPALPLDITDLLNGRSVEWERLELKAGWNPRAVLHTLCAFANDFHNLGGGYVILGVAERDGRPVLPPAGLEPAAIDAIQKELLELGHSAIRPSYHPIAVPYVVEGRHVLVLWAPGGQTRPYRARIHLGKGASDYAWYIRKGSSTVRAKGADEAELMGLAATVPFDDRLNLQARVDDLDRALMIEYLREVGSALAEDAEGPDLEALGRQMHVVGGTSEAPFPLNVGLMFFHPQPRRWFRNAQIDVVWFPDGPGGDRFTEKTFSGPLHRMIRDALGYIERSFLNEIVIKHPDRPEATRAANWPMAAIEEAVVNAVYHRSYELREPVEVRIGRRGIVVLSYPGPDRSVSLDQLRQGRALPRRYRNRRIGELLKELDLTEGRGTGIPKILRAMRGNGSPGPVFEFDEDHSYFAVTLPVHPAVVEALEEPPPEVTAEVAAEVAAEVTEQVGELLATLKGARSRTELQAELGLTHAEHFRLAYLKPALGAGLIEMTIPDKPRSRLQRYRLTAAGHAWKAAHATGAEE